ncbi:MAG TPA: hypothetical protein VL282_00730 [Tepidisphaeraceae bacterium]|nr:hypothetical protein [Tepidisphaeraceae bacterium]
MCFVRFHRTIVVCVAALLFVCAAGCKLKEKAPALDESLKPSGPLDEEQIQSIAMSAADDLAFSVADACIEIKQKTTRPDTQLYVDSLRLGTGIGAFSAASSRNARVGIADLITISMLERMDLEEPGKNPALTEPERVRLYEVFHKIEDTLWTRADQLVVTPRQKDELRNRIISWRETHPERHGLTQVRLQELASVREAPGATVEITGGQSVLRLLRLDPMQGLDPATRQLKESRLTAERLGYWAQRLPMVLGWQMELTSSRILYTGSGRDILKSTTQFTQATSDFSRSTERIAASYENMIKELPKERQAAIEQANVAVQALVKQTSEALAAERKAAIEQTNQALTLQSKSIIDQTSTALTAERKAAVEQAGAELAKSFASFTDRISAGYENANKRSLDHASQIIENERALVLTDAEAASQRLIDRMTIRLIIVIAAGAVIVAIVALIYRLIAARASAPRQSVEPSTVAKLRHT